ncbi:RES family NAD+ phosphorylase [Bacillus sp. 7884-1]|uniref:RES family NAD+ phosphorylase n=1 Tax=Bacillus sp. 7884-1 TaxID=2021693 RepID=UPI0015CEE1B8|nr:RES family NAD+ phosphorylase [Bacillus sp. 7884-1]
MGNFKDEIKHCNRFFPEAKNDIFNDRIDEILEYRTVYTEKVDLFRARLGVHPIGKMMAPPAKLATAGRANPRGISYLYCAIDEPTCIAEIRPWKGATVTVAHVIPKKKLKLVGLFSDPISPFDFESPYEILEIDKILSSFIQELSTPVDPNKSEIEYLPTQYITELINTKGFDGIFFDSAMGPGNNVVIFDENNVDAKSIQIMEVNNIIYNYDLKK